MLKRRKAMVLKTLARHFRAKALVLGLSVSVLPLACRGKAFITMPEPGKDSADQQGQELPAEMEVPEVEFPEMNLPQDQPKEDETEPTPSETGKEEETPMMDPPKEDPKMEPEPDPDPVPEPPKNTFEDGNYIVKGAGSGRCMNVPSSSPTVGTTIDIYDCDKREGQIWNFQHVGDNNYRLVNHWGKAMEVYQGILNNGTAVLTMEVSNKSYQTFRFDKQADGSYIMSVRGTDMRVNVVGSGTANGTQLQIYSDNGNASQRWLIQKP